MHRKKILFFLLLISIVDVLARSSHSYEESSISVEKRGLTSQSEEMSFTDLFYRIVKKVFRVFYNSFQQIKLFGLSFRSDIESEGDGRTLESCSEILKKGNRLHKLPNNKIYQFNFYKTDFLGALRNCESKNLRLLKISDRDEFEVLKAFIHEQYGHAAGNLHEYFLIGLQDIINEGEYMWTDGGTFELVDKKLNSTAWLTGQPTGLEREMCVGLTYISALEIGWNDVDCSNSAFYICEYRDHCTDIDEEMDSNDEIDDENENYKNFLLDAIRKDKITFLN